MRSTTFSVGSTWTWGTSVSNSQEPGGERGRYFYNTDNKAGDTLETIIDRLNLERFSFISLNERQQRLDNIDAVDLYNAVQELNKEYANVCIENYVLSDFLEKNDPKLLIGLAERRETLRKSMNTQDRISTGRTSVSGRSVRSLTASFSGLGTMDRRRVEYRLNYRTKTEMTEKLCVDVERRINEMETKEMQNVKTLNAQIEELGILYDETVGTTKNFKLHFLQDEHDLFLLETGTEKQLEQSLRKFVNNWIKNARALLSTMRLKSTTLQDQTQQLRAELIMKSDLSGILSAVDFEQLIIKRNALVAALEEKHIDMAGLKGITGKASMSMAREKQTMMAIEAETEKIKQKTSEIQKSIVKLDKEIDMVRSGNERDGENLKNLKYQLELYEAPSVNDYINKKDELHMLEKEEKMLNRKISILNLKLNSLLNRCKKLGVKSN